MADALPSHLLMYMFEFLAYEDYKCLVLTCKRFSQAILKHNKLWARECLNRYLSFDLELYSEIYDSEDYKTYIRQKLLYVKENSWRQILEEGEMCRRSLNVVLAQLAGKEEAESFMEYLFETLKQPNLPLLKLKRETVSCNTQTLFQTKLSEVLYEDSEVTPNKKSFYDFNSQFLNQLEDIEKKLFSEMAQYDRNEILRARWYNFEKKETSSSNDNDETICFEDRNDLLFFESPNVGDLTKISNASTDDLQTLKQKPAFLMSLYETLLSVLTHYCQVVHRFLSSIDDIYLIVAEYSARWKVYVCVMLELEKSFGTFAKLMNKHYEALFESYPSYPKFSMWRLMTKVWMSEVYEKSNLNQNLNESFLKILNCHRETNVREIFNNNNNNSLSTNDDINELPKSLFIDLNLKEQQGIIDSISQSQRNFWDDSGLLSSYVQSVQDISFNEVNIHYTDCTDMPINYPYCELEKAILSQTDRFYGEYQQVLGEVPEFFCRFLKSDSSMLSEIVGERTSTKLLQIQTQKEFKTMEEFLDHKLNEIDEQQFKIVENQITLNNELDESTEFIHNFIKEFLEKKNSCGMKIEEGDMEEEIVSSEPKASISQTSLRALVAIIEASASNFRLNFDSIKGKIDFLKTVEKRNEYIRQTNMDKNIPCQLGDIDSLFYDLDKNITLGLLEKLYEDYILHTKQQEQGKMQDLSPLSRAADRNGFEFEQDFFDDVENLDFLMLRESTTLQRDTA